MKASTIITILEKATSIETIITVVVNIILATAAIIGIITYFKTSKTNKAKAAMELVCFYVQNLIPRMGFIIRCADASILAEINEKLENYSQNSNQLYFLQEEMNSIFRHSQAVEKYDKIFDKISLKKVEELYESRTFNLEFFTKFYETTIKPAIGTKNEKIAKKKFCSFMKCLINDTVNWFEYFAMSFLTIGDQTIVYSSIHQTYKTFALFYYIHICRLNHSYHEHYFMNIRRLYNKWNNKQGKYIRFDAKNRERLYQQYKPH